MFFTPLPWHKSLEGIETGYVTALSRADMQLPKGGSLVWGAQRKQSPEDRGPCLDCRCWKCYKGLKKWENKKNKNQELSETSKWIKWVVYLKCLRVTIYHTISNQYLQIQKQILEAPKHCGTWRIGEATCEKTLAASHTLEMTWLYYPIDSYQPWLATWPHLPGRQGLRPGLREFILA